MAKGKRLRLILRNLSNKKIKFRYADSSEGEEKEEEEVKESGSQSPIRLIERPTAQAAVSEPSATATENQADKAKKRKKRRLPEDPGRKKKRDFLLRQGVEGFLITCVTGKERQAAREAIKIFDSLIDEIFLRKYFKANVRVLPDKPLNKKIKFTYPDSSESEEEEESESHPGDDNARVLPAKPFNKKINFTYPDSSESEEEEEEEEEVKESESHQDDANTGCPANVKTDDTEEGAGDRDQNNGTTADDRESVKEENGNKADEIKDPPAKKQCCDVKKSESSGQDEMEKLVDKIIEAELKDRQNKIKSRFGALESGIYGIVFIQMNKRTVDAGGPKEIVQLVIESVTSTKKHMPRFILRVLPILLTCYASEEEIKIAIKPMIAQYFPANAESPVKFAVLYEARANTGIDRMRIIDAVAKSVPEPHEVDLRDPEKTIVVEIVKTVCFIGVVEKFKELAKYNLRQLTSPKE